MAVLAAAAPEGARRAGCPAASSIGSSLEPGGYHRLIWVANVDGSYSERAKSVKISGPFMSRAEILTHFHISHQWGGPRFVRIAWCLEHAWSVVEKSGPE